MAQDNYARLQGRRVALDGATGPFARRCPLVEDCLNARGEFRGVEGVISEGTGPHLASVTCATCGRHLSWVGKSHLDAMLARLSADEGVK